MEPYESDCCEHGYRWDEECSECQALEQLIWGNPEEEGPYGYSSTYTGYSTGE